MNELLFAALLSAAVLGQAQPAPHGGHTTANPGSSAQGTTVTTETKRVEVQVETAKEEEPAPACADWPNSPRALDFIEPWCKLRNDLEERGISFFFGLTQTIGSVWNGGANTAGSTGYGYSLDVDMTVDFGKLLKNEALEGLKFYIYMDTGHNDISGSPNADSGAIIRPNWDVGRYGPLVAEYWIEYSKTINDLSFRARLGKIDASRTFDTNAYANSEAFQFLNGALTGSPHLARQTTNGLLVGWGGELYVDYSLMDGKVVPYIATGFYGADTGYADWGYHDFHNGQNHFLWLIESGVKLSLLDFGNGPMPGTYRMGFYYNSHETRVVNYNNMGGRLPDKFERGYNGWYVSFDQMLFKEKADSDTEGLGMFFRYSTGNKNSAMPYGIDAAIENFYSFGFQYQGLIPGRDNDVLGFGYALTNFNDSDTNGVRLTDEQALELYYKIVVFDWLQITPDIQYIVNPGASGDNHDALVAQLRLQLIF